MQMQSKVIVRAVVAALTLVISGCSDDGQSSQETRKVVAHPAYYTGFETVNEVATKSDEVIIGKVVAERRGPVSVDQDAVEQGRILEVEVEKTIKGSPGETVDVSVFGWAVMSDGQEHEIVVPGGIRLEVGDRVLIALLVDKASGERGGANNEAFYVLENGQVRDSNRTDAVVRRIERMTERQAEETLRSAE